MDCSRYSSSRQDAIDLVMLMILHYTWHCGTVLATRKSVRKSDSKYHPLRELNQTHGQACIRETMLQSQKVYESSFALQVRF